MKIIVGSNVGPWIYNRIGAFDNRMAYVLGFQRLGHEVYFMGDVKSKDCYNEEGVPVAFGEWKCRDDFETWARDYGIWPRCCLIYEDGEASHGMSFDDAVDVAKKTDILVNISGRLTSRES